MATARPLDGEAVALLAPLVKAAAAGAAEGGGGRQQVAAAVASALRAGAALLAPCQASEVEEEVAVREQLGRAQLTEMVKAGRAGVQPRPSVASRAFRGWAQRAEFGGGPHDVPATARDARRRGRGGRRGAGDAEPAGAADAADAATTDDLEAVKEQLEEGREVRAPSKPVEKKKGEMKKLVFQCAPGDKAADEVKVVVSAMGELALVNTRLNNGGTKIDSEKLKDANAPKVTAQLVTDFRKVDCSHMDDGAYDGVAAKVGDDDVFAECSVVSLSVDPVKGKGRRLEADAPGGRAQERLAAAVAAQAAILSGDLAEGLRLLEAE
ncbi:unnamed protein product [Prorocentrum cordatum]|uniref:Uncharacterized protein n=1 Tax=Prorocentrum cordatum TaxID=2364126 RepID=A0ABN9S312_9DINO|nr:unnamed protein product [Polarella glacialis]CAK0826068.1 unnamed protein product [Polarella glacialis]